MAIAGQWTQDEERGIVAGAQQRVAEGAAQLLNQQLAELTDEQYASLRELRWQGYPYAQRHFKTKEGKFKKFEKGKGAGIPAASFLINRQNSEDGDSLSESFNVQAILQAGGVWQILAVNPVAYARYLAEGTATMIKRPFDVVAVKYIKQRVARLLSMEQSRLRQMGIETPLSVPVVQFILGDLEKTRSLE